MSPGNSTRSETGPRKASDGGGVVAKKVVCRKIVNMFSLLPIEFCKINNERSDSAHSLSQLRKN